MYRMPASARARIFSDGTVVVQSSASDMGLETWTTMQIVAAEALAMDLKGNNGRSPLHGVTDTQVTFADGRISLKIDPSRGESYSDILRRNQMESMKPNPREGNRRSVLCRCRRRRDATGKRIRHLPITLDKIL